MWGAGMNGSTASPLEGQAIAGSLPKGFFAGNQQAFDAIPRVPKVLGFGGEHVADCSVQ